MFQSIDQNDQLFSSEPEPEFHAKQVQYTEAGNQLAVQMLKKVRDMLTHVIQLLESGDTAHATRQLVDLVSHHTAISNELETKTGSRVVEGVFDGVCMVGSDGTRYDVSPNYASKSRLVEGDILKLTIQQDGHHVFKQISPVERERRIGRLAIDPSTQEHVVSCDDRVYKVLAASITYFRGIPGDEVTIIVPREGGSNWAAVEHFVRK